MGLFRRLTSIFERIGSVRHKGIIVPAPGIFAGYETPKVSYAKLEEYIKADGKVFRAVEMWASMIAGAGYYTTVPDPEDPEQAKAKEAVDRFAAEVNMDFMLLEVAKDLKGLGNAYLERIFEDGRLVGLKRLPPSSMRVKRDKYGLVEGFKQTYAGQTVTFKPEEVIHLRWNVVGTSAYGTGIVEPVAALLEHKKRAVENMGRIIQRYASPRVIWKVRSEDEATRLSTSLGKLRPDEDPITVGEIEVSPIPIDPRGRFEYYFAYIDEEIFEGMGAPLISWLRNATEASAKAMLEAVEREVKAIQRYIKRIVEAEVFRPLVSQEGLKEVPRLNWGLPRPLEDVNLEQVRLLYKDGLMTQLETRRLLQRLGLPIEAEKPP